MKIPEKTLNCGFSIPALGLGTWQMGGRTVRDPQNDGASSVRALRAGLELGYTHIDTAEMYADGFAEEIVGRAMEGFPRESLFLTTKVWKTHLGFDDLLRAVERSLSRFKTSYLDLCLIHQVSDTIPLTETFRALNRLYDEKIIRNLGVSNFSVERLKNAQACADSKIVVNQVHYNLQVREAEHSGLLDYCQTHDVILTAWRPLQKGLLAAADQQGGRDVLHEMAEKYRTSPSSIAIAWLLNQKNVSAVVMSSHLEHLAENMEAANLRLAPGDAELLRREFPNQEIVSGAVALS